MAFFCQELFYCEDITCFQLQYPPLEERQTATLLGQHSGRWQLVYIILTPVKNPDRELLTDNTRITVNLLSPTDSHVNRLIDVPANHSLDLINVYLSPSWVEKNELDSLSCFLVSDFPRRRLASKLEQTQVVDLLREANAFNQDLFVPHFWQLIEAFKEYHAKGVLH